MLGRLTQASQQCNSSRIREQIQSEPTTCQKSNFTKSIFKSIPTYPESVLSPFFFVKIYNIMQKAIGMTDRRAGNHSYSTIQYEKACHLKIQVLEWTPARKKIHKFQVSPPKLTCRIQKIVFSRLPQILRQFYANKVPKICDWILQDLIKQIAAFCSTILWRVLRWRVDMQFANNMFIISAVCSLNLPFELIILKALPELRTFASFLNRLLKGARFEALITRI